MNADFLYLRIMAYSPELSSALAAAGGPTKLAAGLGLTPGAVTQWDKVPAKHLFRVASLTGIPPERLRPDLMPSADAAE